MYLRLSVIAAALFLLALPAVSEESLSPLGVTGFVPLPGDPIGDRIVVFFDQTPVLPPAADGNRAQPLQFDPPLKGTIRMGENYIAFTPEDLPPNRIVAISLHPELRGPDGALLAAQPREWHAPTVPIAPLRWAILVDADQRAELAMSFPFPVDLDSLRERIQFTGHDGAVLSTTAPRQADRSVVFAVSGIQAWPVRAVIAPGLADASGRIASNAPIELLFPPEAELSVTIEWGEYTTTEQEIVLKFSSMVDQTALSRSLVISDLTRNAVLPVEFLTEGKVSEHRVRVSIPNPRQASLNAVINEGLVSETRARLAETTTQHLQYEIESLRVTASQWEDAGADGLVLNLNLSEELRQTIDADAIAGHMAISPPIDDMRIEYRWDSSLQIYGGWKSEVDYEVRFRTGMPFRDELTLTSDVVRRVKTPPVPGHLAVAHAGAFVFPRREGMALGLDSRNVSEARLIVHRLLPNNLPVALEGIDGDDADWSFRARWSERLDETTIPIDGPRDEMHRTLVAMDELFPEDRRGVFYLEVVYKTERYSPYSQESYESYDSTGKLVVFSDIGALAHWTDEGLSLFAHELYTLTPREGARVAVYSNKNQLLGEGVTDAQGRAHVSGFESHLGNPLVAVISHEGDDSFLQLSARYESDNPMQAPNAWFDREGYDAFVYGDRDLYRPSETVNLAWLMRTNYGDAVAQVPFIVKVYRPNGQLMREDIVETTAMGTGALAVPTLASDATGTYRVSIETPGDSGRTVGSYAFKVEEFVPNRLKATVEPEGGPWVPGEERAIGVLAEHLFGAPASERNAEFSVNLARNTKPFDGFDAFSFQDDSDFTTQFESIGGATTGEDGRGSVSWTVPDTSPTPLTATLYAEVFEEGGRSVVGRETVSILPGGITLGILATEGSGAGTVEVTVVALNSEGAPANLASAEIELAVEEWHYNVRRLHDRLTPSWTRTWSTLERHEVALANGRGSFTLPLRRDGSFRVRASAGESTAHQPAFFFSRWGSYLSASSRDRSELITLSLDRDTYAIGDTAHLEVEVPFKGKVAVLVHAEESQQMLVADIVDYRAQIEIPIESGHFPNAWLEVTAIQEVPEGGTVVHPYASYAAKVLRVDRADRRLSVNFVDLPGQLRPSESTSVTVVVEDEQGRPVQGEVTVALVDEGIHALSLYRTPEPATHFARLRGANPQRAHYYDRVLFNYDRISPGGGSAEDDLAMRVAPPMDSWIKPLALWSGRRTTDANGRVTVSFNLPEFEGQVRLVAVAANDTASGSVDANAFVRRDFVVRASLPRFLLPGDTAQSRVTVFNASDEPGEVFVQWATRGALLPVEDGKRVELAPNAETSFVVPIAVGDEPGQGRIYWRASLLDADGNERDRLVRVDPMPVHAPAAYQKEHTLFTVMPGETIAIPNDDYIENAVFSADLSLAAHPVWQLRGALDDLVGYPYGCLEQTVSRCFPLYALRQYEQLIGDTLSERQDLSGFLETGIARILSMQTGSGGIAMWPRGDEPYAYGSLYALHFLTTVKRGKEFHVPETAFKNLQSYARGIMNRSDSSDSGLFLRAYALYTLALDGDLEAIRQIDRFDGLSLPRDARYLLAAALAMNTQDATRVRLYLEGRPMHDVERFDEGGTLHSPERDRAVMLLTRMQIGDDAADLAPLADELIAFLTSRRFGSTQERAFAVTALTAYLERLGTQVQHADAALLIDGREVPLSGNAVVRERMGETMPPVEVVNRGSVPVYLHRVLAGIPRVPPPAPISEGITLRRSYLTSEGEAVSGTDFDQTRAYIVRLEIETPSERQNVVIADLLPAGLEVSNPRLPGDVIPRGLPEAGLQPAHLDIRDDRVIIAFDTVRAGTHSYYYTVRAVTPGQYTQPTAVAECMYRPQVRATAAGATVTVHE